LLKDSIISLTHRLWNLEFWSKSTARTQSVKDYMS
jgi:hypothetical protein